MFVRVNSFKHNILSLFLRSVLFCDTAHMTIDEFLYHWHVFLQYYLADNRHLPSLTWTRSSPLHPFLQSSLCTPTSKSDLLTCIHCHNIRVLHMTCLAACFLWDSMMCFVCVSFDQIISFPKISSTSNFIISPLLSHLLCFSGNYNLKNIQIIYHILSSWIYWNSSWLDIPVHNTHNYFQG